MFKYILFVLLIPLNVCGFQLIGSGITDIAYIINDQFDSGNCTGWDLRNGMTCDTSSGDALLTESSFSSIRKTLVMTSGHTYNYSITVAAENFTSGSIVFWTGSENRTIIAHDTAVPTTVTGSFTSTNTSFELLFFNANAGGTITISEIKLWE